MAFLNGTPLNTVQASDDITGGAEVAVYDATRKLSYVLGPDGVDVLNPLTGEVSANLLMNAVQVPGGGDTLPLGTANSLAIRGDTLAVALDGADGAPNGAVAFFAVDAAGTNFTWVRTVTVDAATTPGAATFSVPDQLTFTPDGTRLLVALEGEPRDSYAGIDPAGGVGIIDVATGALTIADFTAFDGQEAALRASGVRVRPGTAFSLDAEPEYVSVSADGTRAFVALQENNAIAELDLAIGQITRVMPLGTKDFSAPGAGIDPSDRDNTAAVREVPVSGLYMPDGIASFTRDGRTYIVTANEGDARDYPAYGDADRLSAAVADGRIALDPTAYPDVAAVVTNENLGRLSVSLVDGDTDGDGDIDRITTFGGRSFSIFEVTGDGLVRTFDSGDTIERVLIEQFPALFPDARSDDKGPEPEHVTLGTVDGVLTAFVGLERSSAVMTFAIDSPTRARFTGLLQTAGDQAPEVFTFVPEADAPAGAGGDLLIVPNEGSGTTTTYAVNPAPFRLQILHASDFEAGADAVTRAPNFAAIVDALEDRVANSITLSSGDNFIPGPFTAAGTDASVLPALRAFYEQLFELPAGSLTLGNPPGFNQLDIAILNAIGIQASVIGNHDLDLGPNPFATAIDFIAGSAGTLASITSVGALFPYLSANLDFTNEPALRGLFTEVLRDAASYGTTAEDLAAAARIVAEAADQQIAPWTTIQEGGETIGVLGVTTQLEAGLTSVGGVRVKDPAGDGGVDNMDELASILQNYVDQMTAQGINKIILLSHLQQFGNELSLAAKLRGVDVVISGGSHAIFADSTDPLAPGDTAASGYPTFVTGADGNAVAVVNTGANYTYVGRLVVDFDSNGVIVPGSVNPAESGAFVTTDAGVDAVAGNRDGVLDAAERETIFADGTRAGEVAQLTAPVAAVIQTKDGNVQGYTNVFLEGRRGEVRTEETNLGNLSADANLFVARQIDAGVVASIKNGGGIRAEIGAVVGQPIPAEVPPQANPLSGKPTGAVSQLDIENSLRFNNALSVVTVTAAEFERVLEHAVAATTATATPGQFGQVGGLRFSFDGALQAQVLGAGGAVTTEGLRIRDAAFVDENGAVLDVLVQDGVLQGDAARAIKFVTLSFLADGGDSYPIGFYADARVDLLNNAALADGGATFAAKGSEQDALAEYLRAVHGTPGTAYNAPDTSRDGDTRIQNLAFRESTVLEAPAINGTDTNDRLLGTEGANVISGLAGNDILLGLGGADSLFGGVGNDALQGGAGDDVLDGGEGLDLAVFGINLATATIVLSPGAVTIAGAEGTDRLTGIERLQFADGVVDLMDADALVDDLFYMRANPDVLASGQDAEQHYRDFGAREGRDPNAFFSSAGYLSANADVAAAGVNPLDHYRDFGARENRDPSINFDADRYLLANPDVAAAGVQALEHFLRFGQAEGRATFEAVGRRIVDGFDAEHYLLANPDVGRAGVDALTHYRAFGAAEGRDPNALFDSSAYLATYGDVAAAGVNPLQHYLGFGAAEGRTAGVEFDARAYLEAYGDVAAAGVNPFQHYLQFGIYEGRSAFADQLAG